MSADPFLMLKSVMRVLQTERANIKDRRLIVALTSGMRFYRKHYGNQMIDAWKEDSSFSGFCRVMRLNSGGLVRRGVRSFRNRIFAKSKTRDLNLRRPSPFSRQFGFDRGQPIDRRYIEWFLNGYTADISGHVLEIGGDAYSHRFGGARVAQQDVLHVRPGYPGATIIADLTDAPHIPSDRFDCVILTQTLQFIYDVRAALATLRRILKPGGILLASFPGISQICRDEAYPDTDSWRFTTSSAFRLFTEAFGGGQVQVQAYGNVLASAAFLYGIATHELDPEELDHCDPDYPLLICVRAQKEPNPDETI